MNLLKFIACTVLVSVLTACAGSADVKKYEERQVNVAAEANTQMGVEFLRLGNYEQSRVKLEKALELEPKYAPAHDAIAVLYERVGENKLAEKHYKQSLRIKPDNAAAHSNYGRFLCNQDRYKGALAEFREAAENSFYATPELPLTNAGMCAERNKDTVTAEDYYRQALQKNPKFPRALLRMAIIRYNESNYLGARGYLQRLQEVSRLNPQALWLAVRTEFALNDHSAWGKYAMLLKNDFPDSKETALLREWENERRSGY